MSDNLILPSWLSRGIEEYFPIKGTDQTFSEIIDHAKKNNKKLRVKLGIDPTGTDIHLGHSILFKKLRAFHCLLYTSPSPRDSALSRMPSSA